MRRTTTALLATALAASAMTMPATALAAPAATATGAVSAAALATTPSTGDRFRNTCNPRRAALPASVEGAPALFSTLPFTPHAGAKGLYVWHEPAGWRIRLTHDANKPPAVAPVDATAAPARPVLVEVRGRVTASRPISAVRTVRLEDRQAGEWVSVQRPGRRVMDFRFVNGGFIDGIDFRAGCAGRLTFTVWEVTRDADGKAARVPLPVYFGSAPAPAAGPAPASNPGVLTAPAEVTRVRVLRAPVTTG